MNKMPLIRAIVEQIVFLGTCDDATVDPDAAVSQLELISAILKDLSPQDRRHFLDRVEALAKEEASLGRTERVEFLYSLGENLGLA